MPVQSKDYGSILYNHYLWCLGEGRDTSWWFKDQATSRKLQATSFRTNPSKLQAPSSKHQAPSRKQQGPGSRILHKV